MRGDRRSGAPRRLPPRRHCTGLRQRGRRRRGHPALRRPAPRSLHHHKGPPELIADGPLQRSVEESLRKLRVETVDLLLIHWPNPDVSITECMRALSAAKRAGMARVIGVSNFVVAKVEEAIAVSPEPIAAVQFEYHPYLDQTRLLTAVRRHKLGIIAYCPLALGKVASDARLAAIGKAHSKSAAQVALRWLVQQDDVIAIPKTSNRERLKENLVDLRLSIDRCGNGSDKPHDGTQLPAHQRAAMGAPTGIDQADLGFKRQPSRSSAMSKPRNSTASRAAEPNGSRWQARAMPTMHDVARASGFSQMTVSRAFLESASIKKETRERILNVAEEIGYYHNKAASYLASQRSRAFGIILPTLQDSIYVPFVEGARRVFESHRQDYILQTIDYARGREPYAIRLARFTARAGDHAPLDRPHGGGAEIPGDAADPADRGRQPAQKADRFRRWPFRFRGGISRRRGI